MPARAKTSRTCYAPDRLAAIVADIKRRNAEGETYMAISASYGMSEGWANNTVARWDRRNPNGVKARVILLSDEHYAIVLQVCERRRARDAAEIGQNDA